MSAEALPLWVESCGLPRGGGTEAFLLVHGYGASSFTWRAWLPYLATRGHVLAVDLKGFGRAPKPDDGRYAPADHAEAIRRLVLERDLDRLTLIGHSLGGGVALLVALGLRDAREARRLERLVLVAGVAYRQRLPPFATLARHPRSSKALLRALGPEFVVAQALRLIVFDPGAVTRDQVRGYAAPLHDPAAFTGLVRSARQILPPDLDQLTTRYREIDTPTLLLWGRQDPVVPLWVGERLVRVLPRATLQVLERCGHLPAEERPAESLAALAAFLDASPSCS